MTNEMQGFADFTIDMGANIIAHKQRSGEPITEADKRLIGVPLWTVTGKRQAAPSSTEDRAGQRELQDRERRARVEMYAAKMREVGEARLERGDVNLETLLPAPIHVNMP